MDKKKIKALLMEKGFGVEGAEIAINAIWEYIQKSQAEAIKEFADKLKGRLPNTTKSGFLHVETAYDCIDNVVKEMVGDSNA